jgi:predicted Zn-dependent protease
MARSSKRLSARLLVLLALLPLGCQPAATPAPPRAEPGPNEADSAVERELGRRTDAALLGELHVYDDPALSAYVDSVLERVTAAAAPPKRSWTLRILDTSYVTVRSAPGGYIYVTRGLLAFLGSESELAGALAHEVAHVALHHWKHKLDVLEREGIHDGDLSKLTPKGRLELLAEMRDDERAADQHAVDYLGRAGYSSQGLARVIRLFSSIEHMAGGDRIPSELRTHPATAERLREIARFAARVGADRRDEYLAHIDGLVFGEDPKHGYLFGPRYVNPEADLDLPLPAPWSARIVGRDLLAALPGANTVAFVSRSEHGDLEATRVALASGGTELSETEVADRPAWVGRRDERSGLEMRSALLSSAAGVWVLAVVAPTDAGSKARVDALFQGARRITDPSLAHLSPLRVRVTTLASPSTLRREQAAKPSKTGLQTLALLNGADPDATLPIGTKIKRIDQ